jgi:hypothetical protein
VVEWIFQHISQLRQPHSYYLEVTTKTLLTEEL